MQPTTIRFKGQLYHIAAEMEPAPQTSPFNQALKLKDQMLQLLRALGVGTEDPLLSTKLGPFLPILLPNNEKPIPVPASSVLAMTNNYIMRSGDGELSPKKGAEAIANLDAVENMINGTLTPSIDKIEEMLPQMIALKSAIRDIGRLPEPLKASAQIEVVRHRIKFKGANYTRLWYPIRYAGWMERLRTLVPKAQREVDDLLQNADIETLKDIYHYGLSEALKKSFRDLGTALGALFSRIAGVTGPASLLTTRELQAVKALIPTLLEQINIAKTLLNLVVARETALHEDKMEFRKVRDERMEKLFAEEEAAELARPGRRGRKPKVVQLAE